MSGSAVQQISDPRLAAFLDSGPPDIGTVWELCMYFEFDQQQTVAGIADWLGPPAGLRVLDCACGTGFPALGLIAAGYDVTCTDGSELMLAHFRRNARLAGVDVSPTRLLWEELPAHYADQFDVVLNRGGGNYRYAGVWDGGGLADRQAMADAIRQWVACVRPGGRFYVDIRPAPGPGPIVEDVTHRPTLQIGRHTVDLAERITVDSGSGIRTWNTWLTVDGVEYRFERRAHHIELDELVELLADLGLVQIQQITVPGEFYTVLSAIRPDTGKS
jgi:SAM-dependent methyltransferase